jgi:hypothetical protein
MSADPAQVLRILNLGGVDIRLFGDTLQTRGQVPDDLLPLMIQNRARIITEFQRQPERPEPDELAPETADTDELRAAIRALVDRLRTGELRCESERDPERRDQLDGFWIGLLHMYESLCDRLATALVDEFTRNEEEVHNGQPIARAT